MSLALTSPHPQPPHSISVMKLLLASLSLAAATTASAENPFSAPWFCHDLDCPSFSTRQTGDNDVEIRSYDSLQWATTVVETDSASDAGERD